MLFRKIAFVAVPFTFSSVAWADVGAPCCPFSDENLKENIKPLDHSLGKNPQTERRFIYLERG